MNNSPSPDAGVSITCGSCGKNSPIDQWWTTPMGLLLPPGTVQCPKCHTAIKREPIKNAKPWEPWVKLVKVQPFLS